MTQFHSALAPSPALGSGFIARSKVELFAAVAATSALSATLTVPVRSFAITRTLVTADEVPLTELRSLLLEECSEQALPAYREAFWACEHQRIPAEKRGSRWWIRRSDIPTIASAFGLVPGPASRIGFATANSDVGLTRAHFNKEFVQ